MPTRPLKEITIEQKKNYFLQLKISWTFLSHSFGNFENAIIVEF